MHKIEACLNIFLSLTNGADLQILIREEESGLPHHLNIQASDLHDYWEVIYNLA